MRLIPMMTAILLMQQNQTAKRITKVPEIIPMTSANSPAGMVLMLNAWAGTIFGAKDPSDIRPAVVYPKAREDQQKSQRKINRRIHQQDQR